MDYTRRPIQQTDSVTTREVENEALMLDQASGKIHQLNTSAYFIWKCCDGNNTIEDIIKLVEHEYSSQSDAIENDVITTLQSLLDLQLISNN